MKTIHRGKNKFMRGDSIKSAEEIMSNKVNRNLLVGVSICAAAYIGKELYGNIHPYVEAIKTEHKMKKCLEKINMTCNLSEFHTMIDINRLKDIIEDERKNFVSSEKNDLIVKERLNYYLDNIVECLNSYDKTGYYSESDIKLINEYIESYGFCKQMAILRLM